MDCYLNRNDYGDWFHFGFGYEDSNSGEFSTLFVEHDDNDFPCFFSITSVVSGVENGNWDHVSHNFLLTPEYFKEFMEKMNEEWKKYEEILESRRQIVDTLEEEEEKKEEEAEKDEQ